MFMRLRTQVKRNAIRLTRAFPLAELAFLICFFGFCLVILPPLFLGAATTPSALFERFSGTGVVDGPGGPADDFGRSGCWSRFLK